MAHDSTSYESLDDDAAGESASIFDYAPEQSGGEALRQWDPDIVAVFVVHFDTKAGNTLEWSHPGDIDLAGVEFAAMASGQHTLQEDHLFFVRYKLFGLACFHRGEGDATERFARMRSVGVLTRHYGGLRMHLDFCRRSSRHLNAHPHDYASLLEYFQRHRAARLVDVPALRESRRIGYDVSADGTLIALYNRYGARLNLLWKALVLRRRILFGYAPPLGVACDVVYATCQLRLPSSEVAMRLLDDVRPLFAVRLDDADLLLELPTYVACTSDLLFAEKDEMHDLYGTPNSLHVSARLPAATASALALTKGDYARFRLLDRHVQALSGSAAREQCIRRFFTALTNHLFDTLSALEREERPAKPPTWAAWWHSDDTEFVAHVIRSFRFRVATASGLCCGCCPCGSRSSDGGGGGGDGGEDY